MIKEFNITKPYKQFFLIINNTPRFPIILKQFQLPTPNELFMLLQKKDPPKFQF